MALPMWLLWSVAYVCEVIGYFMGITFKLSLFNVHMLTMHRWFVITAAENDLGCARSHDCEFPPPESLSPTSLRATSDMRALLSIFGLLIANPHQLNCESTSL